MDYLFSCQLQLVMDITSSYPLNGQADNLTSLKDLLSNVWLGTWYVILYNNFHWWQC